MHSDFFASKHIPHLFTVPRMQKSSSTDKLASKPINVEDDSAPLLYTAGGHDQDDNLMDDMKASILHRHAPKDWLYIALAIFFIQGVGTLFPWNAFISAPDYFLYVCHLQCISAAVFRNFSLLSSPTTNSITNLFDFL
mmetsp:Transcript_5930/g.22510  ORF Transcript_5930/g.22510 Transcript_5930/m.22510 type:complete len:138 (-) Transcript_5930:3059-3472(-)